MALRENALRKVARASGLTIKQVRQHYRGETPALLRAASKRFPAKSFARFRYEKRIAAIQTTNRIDREIAVMFYRTREKVKRGRYRTVYVESATATAQQKDVGVLVRAGFRKGQLRLAIDTDLNRPISKETADTLRSKNFALRMELELLRNPWNGYRKLHKYFRPSDLKKIRARKPKRPTPAEARRAAEKIGKNWTPKLYKEVVDTFGDYI